MIPMHWWPGSPRSSRSCCWPRRWVRWRPREETVASQACGNYLACGLTQCSIGEEFLQNRSHIQPRHRSRRAHMAARKKPARSNRRSAKPEPRRPRPGAPDRKRAADLAGRHGRHRQGAEGRPRGLSGSGGRRLQAPHPLALDRRTSDPRCVRDGAGHRRVAPRFGPRPGQRDVGQPRGTVQNRVHKALQQLGVPSGDEIRLLTKRVAELNENVKALSARQPRGRVAGLAKPKPRHRGPCEAQGARRLTAHAQG